jgi:subtilisin family serine protease
MRKICFLVILFSLPVFALMSPDLMQVMSSRDADDLIPVDIVLEAQMDIHELESAVEGLPRPERRVTVARLLEEFSRENQHEVLQYLHAMEEQGKVQHIRTFWINNAIYCDASQEVILELDVHKDIYYVDYDLKHMELEKPQHQSAVPDRTREIAWGVLKVRADQVWSLGYTGDGIIVGVIDTGVNYNHVDLASHMWEDPNYPNHGWNFEYNNDDPMDIQGHGTHCAGSVASDGTAGSQCGVAPEAQIMALRVRTQVDTVAENQIWAAMEFVVSPPLSPVNGGDLISMSLGFWYSWNPRRSTWRTNCNNVGAAGIVMIVAAGNERQYFTPPEALRCPGDVPSPWPNPENGATGALSDVVSIGATDINDVIANFSSPGPVSWQSIDPFYDYPYPPGLVKPDVSAPGVNIKSCSYSSNTGYLDGWDGTSMATPHVAGTVALMLEKNPLLTPRQIDSILQTTAVDLGTTGKDNDFGAGRIDALDAVNATPGMGVYLALADFWLVDTAPGGNGNGWWESGEEIDLVIEIYNAGIDTAQNTYAVLNTSDSYATIISDSVYIGVLLPADTTEVSFRISASVSTPAEHLADFDLGVDATGGSWDYGFSVYINPLPLITFQHVHITGGNDNGILDPGETADVIVTVKNEGVRDAENVTSILLCNSSLITINDGSGDFGFIAVDDTANNAADPYTVTADSTTPTGTSIAFGVEVVSGSYIDTLEFSLVVGRKHYFLWNPDPTPTPGQNMHQILGDLGYSGDYSTASLASDLSMYQAVIVCVGIFSNNYVINSGSAEAAALVDFLQNQNGRMYLEGGDVWYYDPMWGGYDFCPLFGIDAVDDGDDDLGPVVGESNAFTTGMNFGYGGENNWIDHINPQGSAFLIFHDGDNSYNCGVANDAGTYRTVGTSFELGLLTDGSGVSTREVLIDSIMKFFGIQLSPGVEEHTGMTLMPLVTQMNAVYPNPMTRTVNITYQLARRTAVSLALYDAAGRLVQKLADGIQDPGHYTTSWSAHDSRGRSVPAGIYFVRFRAEDNKKVEKIVLVR